MAGAAIGAAAVGAGVGGGFDIGAQLGQGLYSAWANRKARSDWRKSLQRGPTYAVQGLRAAGINPLYAFGKGYNTGQFSQQAASPAGRGGASVETGARAGQLISTSKDLQRILRANVHESRARAGIAENEKIILDRMRERETVSWSKEQKIWKSFGKYLGSARAVSEATGLRGGSVLKGR